MKQILILICLFGIILCYNSDFILNKKHPTILIVTLIRNKAHVLPYFFSYLENLNYPKDRISLWLRLDHNIDNSIEITNVWLNKTANLYHSVDFRYDEQPTMHENETGPYDWPKGRFSHVIKLKETALGKAKSLWADFVFFLDADVLLTNAEALNNLVEYNLPIVAPMLFSEDLYSNFWCGMSENYYYHRTDEYKEIYRNEKMGNFHVPMVHTAVLVNLNYKNSDLLTFDRQKLISNQKRMNIKTKLYDGPVDDIIIFAIAANSSDMKMFVSNEHPYGYILPPLDKDDNKQRDIQQLINIKTFIINDLNQEVRLNEELQQFVLYPERHTIFLSHIYMINLERRPERRFKMELTFKELGIEVEHVPAVDGKKLNLSIIENMGIKFLPGYEDPYYHRQMTMGEIGCFLSHYKVWKKMVKLEQSEVLILEDDIRFDPYFKEKAITVMDEARKTGEWDLVYFGRKKLEDQDEPWINDTNTLVKVGYSYWTLGYVISLNGAKKLLNVRPLEKLIPVDEFLPIMFDRHPNNTWKEEYEPRNLIAYSAAPLLLYPTHYTGDDGYISDTEDSDITPVELVDKSSNLKNDKEMIQGIFDAIVDDEDVNSKHERNVLSTQWGKVLKEHDRSEL